STRLNSSHVEISYAVFCLTKVQTCALDRKSTRLNSSHVEISYAVFFLKKNENLLALEVGRVDEARGGECRGRACLGRERDRVAGADQDQHFLKNREPPLPTPFPPATHFR